MGFRLGLLNPNTETDDTDSMAAVARAALPADSAVVALTARRGPQSIEGYTDEAVAAAEVVQLVRACPDLDAYLVACFGDPGVNAARELTEAPVVGIGEAAFSAVSFIASRFAVITTLRRGIPELEDALERRGIGRRCVGVLALAIAVSKQGSAFPETTEKIVAAGTQAIDLGAEAIVLACGGMADVSQEVSSRLSLPVCDGVSTGALFAYALWSAGLRTSKIGAFAWPEPIAYEAMIGFVRTEDQ